MGEVTTRPTVSAVIPCRNERGTIERCVRSVLAQEEPPGGFEVIVADGMSDDGTREILAGLAAADPRLRIIDNPQRTTPCAMNAGIRTATGRYVAIMGAHNWYAPDYLRRCVEVIERVGADDVGGAVFAEASTYMQRAVAASHHSWFSVGGSRWHDPGYEGPADTVWGGCYRREVFDRIGMFDEDLVRNQDDELNLRLSRSGGLIWQSPRIRSWYTPRSSIGALFRQYRQYGFWKVRVIRKHRLPASPRHLAPGAFVAILSATAAVATAGGVIAVARGGEMPAWTRLPGMVAMALSLAYGAAAGVATATTAAEAGWELAPVLPGVFAAYHAGYGVGFIEGLLAPLLGRRGPRAAMSRLTR